MFKYFDSKKEEGLGQNDNFEICFLVNGVMVNIVSVPKVIYEEVISRVKISIKKDYSVQCLEMKRAFERKQAAYILVRSFSELLKLQFYDTKYIGMEIVNVEELSCSVELVRTKLGEKSRVLCEEE
jgi:hypothetical protein